MKELKITSKVRETLKPVKALEDILPRNQCEHYINMRGGEATLTTKSDFDSLFRNSQFDDGPYKEPFGSDYGEPYNPNRQAFGTLNDGRVFYCELNPDKDKEVQSYLESSTEIQKNNV